MNLTYDDVKLICEKNESFKMKHQRFGDTLVAQCTYFLASAGDFFDAHRDGSMIRATELRGLTFIKEGDNDWRRFLFLDKFFNINQTSGSDVTLMDLTINGVTIGCNINKLYSTTGEKVYRALDLKVGMSVGEYDRATEIVGTLVTIETIGKSVLPTQHIENSWMYNDVKHLEIVRVANKDDGSCIRFLMINGELVAKTKFSFESEQTNMAMQVVDTNPKLKEFILKTLDMGIAALFEIVSPLNKVVLSYNETSLRLLQMRVESTGEYLDIYNNDLVKEFDILTAVQEPLYSLDELLSLAETVENKEGWIITFNNGKMAKVKTEWYLRLHGLLTGGLKEHLLVAKILDEEIDDLLAHIPTENTEERDFINELTGVVVNYTNHLATVCFDTFNKGFKGDRKEFVLAHKSDVNFHLMTCLFQENTFERIEKHVIDLIKSKTRRLEMAKSFLQSIGFKRELKIIEDDN